MQSTTVATSIRQPTERRRHRFSWINEWKERIDIQGRAKGIELILPDWFYAGVMMDALVLTIDRAYFDLTGGLERWLYRLVRKHGGHSSTAGASASTISTSSRAVFRRSNADFALDLRRIAAKQSLPGYRLALAPGAAGQPRLTFQPNAPEPLLARRRARLSRAQPVDKL